MNEKPHSPYVIGNWKMHPQTLQEAKRIFRNVKDKTPYLHHVNTVLCPPFVYISSLTHEYSGKTVGFGAQDVFFRRNTGSFTGEISADQLTDLGVEYVIVGHSERRALGETNEIVAKKTTTALKAGLKPIVCIGEQHRDEDGEYLAFLSRQLHAALADTPEPYRDDICIAYEPLWAIGGSADDAMSPHELHQMVLFIRKVLRDFFSAKRAESLPIIYGGSVERSNAHELIAKAEVNGFLPGHASLDPNHFVDILEIVNEYAKDEH
jgi:triosephosphate isomerase